MTEDDFLDQCNLYLDGAMTPDQAAQFLAVAQAHTGFKNLLADLTQAYQQVDHFMKEHALLEPAPMLSDRIASALAFEYADNPQSGNVVSMLAHPRHNRPFQMKVVAAMLLLITAGFVPMIWQQHVAQMRNTAELSHQVQSMWTELDELNGSANDTLDQTSLYPNS